MANPQIENGHVDIANEIIEALAKIRISGEEMQCLWVIFRKTYGWHKKEDIIALSQFCEYTRMKKSNICRSLSKLLSKKIIAIIKNDNGITTYRFNKDYDSWKPLSKKITLSKVIKGGLKKDNESLSLLRHTKETIQKKTIQKVQLRSTDLRNGYKTVKQRLKSTEYYNCPYFKQFWELYPKKTGKGKAWEEWEKITVKKDENLVSTMQKVLNILKETDQWKKEKGQFIPLPATWLHQRRWEDEIDTERKSKWDS